MTGRRRGRGGGVVERHASRSSWNKSRNRRACVRLVNVVALQQTKEILLVPCVGRGSVSSVNNQQQRAKRGKRSCANNDYSSRCMSLPAQRETNGCASRARVEEVRKDRPFLFRAPFSGVLQHARLMQTRINASPGNEHGHAKMESCFARELEGAVLVATIPGIQERGSQPAQGSW